MIPAHCSAIARAIPGKVLDLIFAVIGLFQARIFPFSSRFTNPPYFPSFVKL
ncbi:hypothetical protein [Enterocloster phage PMBT24]|uniref:Uncharacterized protein n=1 Tax=Enterocloster phage PMBT24 TaxID=3025413 RepID=A0AAT9TVI2_9CAUD|nr:hypothetical protein [Enterocloster phage PMBT24]